ncbi:NEDD4-binding protein 1 [Drosophila tropicalis]|uniref:NEDD4-binding protein 1 n=1 Tax=Drosophila tropicalis TaxID=46794 RepID=UPI0035AB71BD
MGKKSAKKPKGQTKTKRQIRQDNRNARVKKNKHRQEVVKLRLSPGTSNGAMKKPEAKNKLRALLRQNFQKFKDDKIIKTPKPLRDLPKPKRKLDFKTNNKNPTPMKPLTNLPKPKFYRPPEICGASSGLLNETIEDGEIIEELDSSCDDDCIILDPSSIYIDIETEENSLKEQTKYDTNANEKMQNNDNDSFILKDSKRNAELLWKQKTDNGLLYSTISKTHKPQVLDNEDTGIITIDDSFDIPESKAVSDDSIIVLEDYIPLSSGTELPKADAKPMKKPKRPVKKTRLNDSLFTTSDRKKLTAYNTNTFNPSEEGSETEVTKTESGPENHKRSIVIDGSNVAFGHGNSNVFSAEGIKYCLQYFEKMGHNVKAVVPLFRKNPTKSSNPELLDRLYKEGKIVFTPCKNLPGQMSSSYDDRFILQIAYEWNAAIVSNDNYRDLINENVAFKKIIENRVIGYSWCDNMFILAKDPYGRWGPQLDEILRC